MMTSFMYHTKESRKHFFRICRTFNVDKNVFKEILSWVRWCIVFTISTITMLQFATATRVPLINEVVRD